MPDPQPTTSFKHDPANGYSQHASDAQRPKAKVRNRKKGDAQAAVDSAGGGGGGDAADDNAKRRCVSTACIACRRRKSKVCALPRSKLMPISFRQG